MQGPEGRPLGQGGGHRYSRKQPVGSSTLGALEGEHGREKNQASKEQRLMVGDTRARACVGVCALSLQHQCNIICPSPQPQARQHTRPHLTHRCAQRDAATHAATQRKERQLRAKALRRFGAAHERRELQQVGGKVPEAVDIPKQAPAAAVALVVNSCVM